MNPVQDYLWETKTKWYHQIFLTKYLQTCLEHGHPSFHPSGGTVCNSHFPLLGGSESRWKIYYEQKKSSHESIGIAGVLCVTSSFIQRYCDDCLIPYGVIFLQSSSVILLSSESNNCCKVFSLLDKNNSRGIKTQNAHFQLLRDTPCTPGSLSPLFQSLHIGQRAVRFCSVKTLDSSHLLHHFLDQSFSTHLRQNLPQQNCHL